MVSFFRIVVSLILTQYAHAQLDLTVYPEREEAIQRKVPIDDLGEEQSQVHPIGPEDKWCMVGVGNHLKIDLNIRFRYPIESVLSEDHKIYLKIDFMTKNEIKAFAEWGIQATDSIRASIAQHELKRSVEDDFNIDENNLKLIALSSASRINYVQYRLRVPIKGYFKSMTKFGTIVRISVVVRSKVKQLVLEQKQFLRQQVPSKRSEGYRRKNAENNSIRVLLSADANSAEFSNGEEGKKHLYNMEVIPKIEKHVYRCKLLKAVVDPLSKIREEDSWCRKTSGKPLEIVFDEPFSKNSGENIFLKFESYSDDEPIFYFKWFVDSLNLHSFEWVKKDVPRLSSEDLILSRKEKEGGRVEIELHKSSQFSQVRSLGKSVTISLLAGEEIIDSVSFLLKTSDQQHNEKYAEKVRQKRKNSATLSDNSNTAATMSSLSDGREDSQSSFLQEEIQDSKKRDREEFSDDETETVESEPGIKQRKTEHGS